MAEALRSAQTENIVIMGGSWMTDLLEQALHSGKSYFNTITYDRTHSDEFISYKMKY